MLRSGVHGRIMLLLRVKCLVKPEIYHAMVLDVAHKNFANERTQSLPAVKKRHACSPGNDECGKHRRYGDVLTDGEGLPLVYDSDLIGQYWDKRPGEASEQVGWPRTLVVEEVLRR